MVTYKLIRILRALLKLNSLERMRNFLRVSKLTSFDSPFIISLSQAGEDVALLSVFGDKQPGTYIDIGAHHPSRFSVTSLLYTLGWSGVNVDANPELIKEFQNVRKRDINLCVAVGLEQRYSFYIFDEPAVSTISPIWRERFISEKHSVSKVIEVQGKTLREILDNFEKVKPVDLISIDAEGSDLEVLQSLYFNTLEKSRFPKWLLVETAPPVKNSLEEPSVKLAISWGYEPYLILSMSTLLKLRD